MAGRYADSVFLRRDLPEGSYLTAIPAVRWLRTHRLELDAPVTFLVGENGSGKSTLLEAMAVASVPVNFFFSYPVYAAAFGGMEAIIGAYQAINPNMTSLLGCLIVFNMPFTLAKGLIDALLCFLIYKPLSPILHGRH